MTKKYGKKKFKQNNVVYTIVTAILLCLIFIGLMSYLYKRTEEEAYENLHVQTKQIKDDIVLQLISDRENLTTMASFASKLYSDGEDYHIMFESFKPIGLIENIGILTPDNVFVTKAGSINLDGSISFEDEKRKGSYISGRVDDLTNVGNQLIRSAVPIKVNGQTVGILYGVIKLDKIGYRYNTMAQEFNAQLFVYDNESGKLVIDTVHRELGNISFLKDRKYNDGYSYEQMMSSDKGFSSFMSAYRNENLYMHYSAIEEFDWTIAMGRYDSQVFANTHAIAKVLVLVFFIMIFLIVLYVIIIMTNERKINSVTECASDVRKELLETTDGQNNIHDALTEVCKFAQSHSVVFFDTNGEFYYYIAPGYDEIMITEEERKTFSAELLRYASDFHKMNSNAINILCIQPNLHLLNTNPDFFDFLKEHGITEVSFSSIINSLNHIAILASVNSKRGKQARMLAEKVSACFSMALYNKNHLNKTTLAAITDSLTGAYNRVAYKQDLARLDEEKPSNFACIYIDVNELHICNNKYGHAAGDEMLSYVANTLKEVFYGQKLYRMGGDEFLVFCREVNCDEIKKGVELFENNLRLRNYHAAVGTSFRTHNVDTEEMVKEAEVRMYEAKAEYYQSKERRTSVVTEDSEYVQVKTGILEIDTMLSVLKEKYNGIYRVSLVSDKARRILMPSYLNYNENEENFSNLFSKYVEEIVSPDYHRALMSFLNFEALKHQLMEGKIPKITYNKTNGEIVTLSVYKLCDTGEVVNDTLWVFAKE